MAADGLVIQIDVEDGGARGKLRDLDVATDKIGSTATTMGSAVEKSLQRVTSSTFETTKSATELHRAMLEAFENPMAAMQAFGQSLTSDVLEALGPIGIAAGVVGGAVVGLGLVMFETAEKAARLGATLQDESEKTGIAVESLSTLKVAAEIAGGSLEQITNAIFMMQRRMAEDPTGFEDGLRRIGVSLKSIQDLSPDEQFLRLDEALQHTADASQRNAAGAEIFGRQFRDMAALMQKDLPGLIDLSKQMGATWSDQDARAAEELEMKTRALHAQWTIFTDNIGKAFIPALMDLVEWFNRAANPGAGHASAGQALDPKANQLQTQYEGMAKAGRDAQGVLEGLAITIGASSKETAAAVLANKAYNDEVEKLKTAHEALNDTTKARILYLLSLNDSETQIARILGVSETAVKALAEAHKKAGVETQKWLEAETALLPIISSPAWDGTVEGMVRLGGSVEQVAIYMGAMKGAVEAAKFSMENLKKADDDWRAIHLETMKVAKKADDEFAKARTELLKAVNESVATALLTQQEYERKTLTDGGDQLAIAWADALNKLGPPMVGFEESWQRAVNEIDRYFETKMTDRSLQLAAQAWGREIANSFATGFQTILNGFPDLIAQALTGGGGIGGALQAGTSQIGALIGKKMFGVESPLNATIANGVSHLFGDSVAGGLSAALPGIGSAIGSLVGPALNALMNIGGPSKDELAARDTFGSFQKQFGTMQQTIDAVGDAYKQMGKTGTDAQRDLQAAFDATHISAAAEESALKKINDVLGAQKKYIDDVKAAGAGIIGNVNDVVGGTPFAGLHTDAMAAQKTVHDLMNQNVDQNSAPFKKAMDDLNAVNQRIASTAKTAGGELADLGMQAVAAFTAAVGSGQSEQAALKAIHPTLVTLADAYKDLGLQSGDVALHTLMMRDQIVSSAPQLVNAIGGLTGEMSALNTMGLLNVDTLGAIERTGTDAYNRLVAKVHELGGTDADALSQMQDFLHHAEDAAKKLGIPLDDNTKKLIDQSQKAGIWQDAITPQDKLLKGMQDLVDKVQHLIDHLNGIPSKVDTTVTTTFIDQHQAVNLPPIDSSGIDTSYASHGGYVTPAGIQYLARGNVVSPLAWMPRGTDTVPAMLTPGEGVLNRGAMRRLGADGLRALNSGGAAAPAGDTINVTVNVAGSVRSDRELTDVVMKEIKGHLDRRRRTS